MPRTLMYLVCLACSSVKLALSLSKDDFYLSIQPTTVRGLKEVEHNFTVAIECTEKKCRGELTNLFQKPRHQISHYSLVILFLFLSFKCEFSVVFFCIIAVWSIQISYIRRNIVHVKH